MRQSTWEAWFIASLILAVSVMVIGAATNSDAFNFIVAISIVSINLALCLYQGSKTDKK